MAGSKNKKAEKDAAKLAAAAAKASNMMEAGGVDGEIVPFHMVEKKKEMSRAEKEWLFIQKKIATRLKHLLPEARYDQTKGCCGIIGFLFMVAGTVLVLKALSLTVLFAADPFSFPLLAAGCSMAAPCLVWFVYIFIWPHLPCSHCRNIKAARNFVHDQRRERHDPTLFNNMVAAANKDSEPPIIRTRLFAMFRKKEYTIVCHTMEEFQEIFHFKTGVQPDRQLIKLREDDGSSYVFKFKPEDFILDLAPRGIVKDTLFWVYAKGGFENDVLSSPEFRMDVPRAKGSPVEKMMVRSVKRYERGPAGKDELETELDEMLQKELDAAVEGEMARDAEEEAAREAAMEEKDGDSQSPKGLLAWLSPFKSPPRLSPEEEAALDPHDDEFRAEMAAINEARLERLRPPTPEPEKKRFVGL